MKATDGLTSDLAKAILIPKAKLTSGRGGTMLSSSDGKRAAWMEPRPVVHPAPTKSERSFSASGMHVVKRRWNPFLKALNVFSV